jgi:ABC-2 type transport system permease protein
MPIFFLSGALFPLKGLPKIMEVITKINPLSYGVDGLRGTLINSWNFNIGLDFAVLTILALVILAIGSYLFSKIQI